MSSGCHLKKIHFICKWQPDGVLIRLSFWFWNDNRMGLPSGFHFQISYTSNRKIILFVVDNA